MNIVLNEISSPDAKKALLDGQAPDTDLIGLLNEDDLAECLLTAAYSGRLTLMRELVAHRGPIPLRFEHTLSNPAQYLLNGRHFVLDTSKYLRHIKSTKGLKALFTAIEAFGLKGLLEPGPTYPLLLREIDERVKHIPFTRGVFSGQLPELRQDTLSHPELAIAMSKETEGPVTPDAYRPILCWASKDMARQFPERLAPLKPYQQVGGSRSIKDFKASFDPEKPDPPLIITVGVHAPRREGDFTKYLFRQMAPESIQMGFEDEAGRVLCETTTDFLLSFPTVNHSEENHQAARAFVEQYCPYEIIATQTARVCASDFGSKPKSTFKFQGEAYWFNSDVHTQFSYGDSRLFEMLSLDHPLRDRALNMMERQQWLWLIEKYSAQHSSARCLLALRDTFGLDNAGMKLILTPSKLSALLDAGYRFVDETSVFLDLGQFDYASRHTYDPRFKSTVFLKFDAIDWRPPQAERMPDRQVQDHIVGQYQNILKGNLWPCKSSKPTDVNNALQMLSAHGKSLLGDATKISLHAYLKNAGLEACLQAAPEHLPKLLYVFARGEFDPHLKTLPNKLRGLVLENDMGL
jgi:hypothetical protein